VKKLTLIERVDLSKIRKVRIETLDILKFASPTNIAEIVRNKNITFDNLEVQISYKNAPNLLRSLTKHRKDIKKVHLKVSLTSYDEK
jgi:predicted transcriptional regulator